MVRWAVRAIAAFFKPKASLVAENLCLRQQLLVLQRRHARPRLRDKDRRFWILASRWCPHWRKSLLIVTPGTVMGWHRNGWKAYWRWRSRRTRRSGRKTIPPDVKFLIRRMATENFLGQKRIQAELARLGVTVSARTVAKYMRGIHRGKPSPGWRYFLTSHDREISAYDFFCVQTIFFRTIYVFSSFIAPVAKSCMSEPRVTRQASGRDSKSSRLAVGIVSCRAFSCMTATAATERPSIAGSTTSASHRSALRSDRTRPTPSRSGG